MSDTGLGPAYDTPREGAGAAKQKLVWVHSEGRPYDFADAEISLGELWAMVWRGKWIILSTTFLFAALAVAYALTATEWFRASTLLAPAEQQNSELFGSEFGGLASLAGVDMASQSDAVPIAVLLSREFARDFIETQGLITVLFADEWDAEGQRWLAPDRADWPDIRDAVKLFHEEVLSVEKVDPNLVSVAVEWTDPEVAASWARMLVDRLNRRMRERSLAEAEANVEYLEAELAKTSLLTIQQSIGRLLESEFQKVMMAKGRREFSFRVIDPAYVPKERSRPRRALIAVLGTLLGGVIGLFAALVLGLRNRPADEPSS